MGQKLPPDVDRELVAELRHYRKLTAALPHDEVTMDLPEGARVRTERGTWKVKWRKYQFLVGPLSKEEYHGQVALFSQPATGPYAHFYSIAVTPATFENVRGTKCVQIIREVGSKTVQYALEVPGGYVCAAIVRRDLEWDEADWEPYLPSIQILKK